MVGAEEQHRVPHPWIGGQQRGDPRGRAFLTGTQLAGAEALRACLLNPATTKDDLVVLLDEIRAAAAEIRKAETHL
jgi:hypothetical protein